MSLVFYTDGSASPNPGPGGFAVISDGKPVILGGEPEAKETTNIRMEGFALLRCLEHLKGKEAKVYSDSEFWINVLTKWAITWEKNNWIKKGGIKNLDIVKPLYEAYKKSNAELIWVRGHNGQEGNELADQWANKAREEILKGNDPMNLIYKG